VPDPVALAAVHVAALGATDGAAVVRLIPANGVEHVLAIAGEAITERLTRHNVVRQPGQECRA
jgi:hypothetical protein